MGTSWFSKNKNIMIPRKASWRGLNATKKPAKGEGSVGTIHFPLPKASVLLDTDQPEGGESPLARHRGLAEESVIPLPSSELTVTS